MRTYERNWVHVDQCSDCRGLFLDRGELDRLVEAESSFHREPPARDHDESRGYGHHDHGGRHHQKRRKHFLEELFD